MKDPDTDNRNPRAELVREAATLQIKLLVDGLRDALLIPLSLVAALIGLLRGGPDCDREFRRVIKLGRRSERWINLFGREQPLGRAGRAGSMDSILREVETTAVEQFRRSRKVDPATPSEQAPATANKREQKEDRGSGPG